MNDDNRVIRLRQPAEIDDPLTAVLRAGARRLLEQAIEAEVEAFLSGLKEVKLADGRDRVVRPGHGPATARSGRSRPGSDRSRSGAPRSATAAPNRQASGSASPRRCCRAGRGAPPAWTPCCRCCTCAASQPVTFRKPSACCWAETRRTCRRRRSRG